MTSILFLALLTIGHAEVYPSDSTTGGYYGSSSTGGYLLESCHETGVQTELQCKQLCVITVGIPSDFVPVFTKPASNSCDCPSCRCSNASLACGGCPVSSDEDLGCPAGMFNVLENDINTLYDTCRSYCTSRFVAANTNPQVYPIKADAPSDKSKCGWHPPNVSPDHYVCDCVNTAHTCRFEIEEPLPPLTNFTGMQSCHQIGVQNEFQCRQFCGSDDFNSYTPPDECECSACNCKENRCAGCPAIAVEAGAVPDCPKNFTSGPAGRFMYDECSEYCSAHGVEDNTNPIVHPRQLDGNCSWYDPAPPAGEYTCNCANTARQCNFVVADPAPPAAGPPPAETSSFSLDLTNSDVVLIFILGTPIAATLALALCLCRKMRKNDGEFSLPLNR